MALAVLGGTFWVLWLPMGLCSLGTSPVQALLKKKSCCGSVTDFEMMSLAQWNEMAVCAFSC
jgi:hypothetical protein